MLRREKTHREPWDLLIRTGRISQIYQFGVYWRYVRTNTKTTFEVAGQESIETAFNEKRTYALATDLGVPCPHALYPESIAQVEKLSLELEYPVVVKAMFEEDASVVHYPCNREQLLHAHEWLCTERDYAPPCLPMLQEYVFGDDTGYSFADLYKRGIGERVFPEFWASLEVALVAGVNFPQLICDMTPGQELSYSEEYKLGVRYHWPLSREPLHVAARPGSLPAVIWVCLDPGTRSNVWIAHPKPSLLELARTLAVLGRQLPLPGKLDH